MESLTSLNAKQSIHTNMKKILLFSLLLSTNCLAQKLPESKPLKIDVAKLQYREAKVNSVFLYLAGASFLLMSQERGADGYRGFLFLTGAALVFEGTRIRWDADEKYFQAKKIK